MHDNVYLNLQNEGFPVFLKRFVGTQRIPGVVTIEVIGKMHQDPVESKTNQ
jgi:hypothetical protein